MDLWQQLFLLFIGIAFGLAMGVIIGILIQKNRIVTDQKRKESEQKDIQYGSVTPDQIHTLREENKEEQKEAVDILCPVCGHVNPPDNLFCYDCGGRLH